jgi:3-hydroxybutyryl-CoA dehydrogenase
VPEAIKAIGVVGAGQMGRGIAQVAAQNRLTVMLLDASAELAQKGKDRLAKDLEKLVAKGRLNPDERTELLARIKPTGNYADLGAVDFAVEAATENQQLKQQIFVELDKNTKPGAILASNTSSISITLLSSSTKRPDRVIGMHFMNPVPVMKLIEIIRGLPTSEDTYRETAALAEKLGKTTVESRDIPGFIVNRLLMPQINEACFALYEGLGTAKDIDTACKLGLNHPMGPMELADLVGLDTTLSILEVLQRELGDDKYRPCPLLRQYVAAGWLGRKSGRGFYTY